MAYAIGVAIFALGILISVAIHEAGHMWTARAFGMKVTRYFIGFGPTLWSFKRGETEYGIKPIPAGAFVKIIGMTPLEDEEDVKPEDKHRVFWKKPLWQRTIVLSAGSISHFIIGFVLLWIIVVFMGLPDPAKIPTSAATVGMVSPCVTTGWEVDAKTKMQRPCKQGSDPESPAAKAGLKRGDVVTAVNGSPVKDWQSMVTEIKASGGKSVSLTYTRDGATRTATVDLPVVERRKQGVNKPDADTTADEREKVGVLGVSAETPVKTVGPIDGVGEATKMTGMMFSGVFDAMKKFPEKVPKLWAALTGEERDPETPVSVVGASRLGGEFVEYEAWTNFVLLLAVLNLFVGVFNLIPLLPLDGGHIAIAWFEKARSWVYARLGKPDPGRVDYLKLMPITYFVIIVFAGFSLLTIAADIVNPISLFSR